MHLVRRRLRAQLSLRFTDEQKAELLRARRTYFMRVGPLLQERATIQSRLQARPSIVRVHLGPGVFAEVEDSMLCGVPGRLP